MMTTDERMQNIEDDLDAMDDKYVPRKEVEALFKVRDDNIADLEKRLDNTETSRRQYIGNLPSWIGLIISIISLIVALKP